MKIYNSKAPLISLHIAKAGGSSFKKILQKWFHIGYHSHYRNYKNMVDPPKHIGWRLYLTNIVPICIHGHFDEDINHGVYDYYPEAEQFITILRDPFETWVSMYNYILTTQQAKSVSEKYKTIDEFFYTHELNTLNLFPFNFSHDNYQTIIQENFVHIGVMENYQKSIEIIAEKINKKSITVPHENKSKFSQKPTKEAEDFFRNKYKLEFEIYEYARKLNL